MIHPSAFGLASASLFLLATATLSFAQDLNSIPQLTSGEREELRQLRIEQKDVLREVADVFRGRYQNGSDNITFLLDAETALAKAELALASSADDRVRMIEDLVERLKQGEEYQEVRMKARSGRKDELAQAKAAHLGAKVLLLVETLGVDAAAASEGLRQLRVEQRDLLREVADVLRRRYRDGIDNISFLLEAETALTKAELALASSADDRVRMIENIVERLKKMEEYQDVRLKVGAGRKDELAQAKAAHLGAKVLLLVETLGNGAAAESEELRQLRVEHRDALREAADVLRRRYRDGTDNISFSLEAVTALARAELALASSADDRVRMIEDIVERLKKMEEYEEVRLEVGTGRRENVAQAKAARIRAEILLAEQSSPTNVPQPGRRKTGKQR